MFGACAKLPYTFTLLLLPIPNMYSSHDSTPSPTNLPFSKIPNREIRSFVVTLRKKQHSPRRTRRTASSIAAWKQSKMPCNLGPRGRDRPVGEALGRTLAGAKTTSAMRNIRRGGGGGVTENENDVIFIET